VKHSSTSMVGADEIDTIAERLVDIAALAE
jgi:hypothetical protein